MSTFNGTTYAPGLKEGPPKAVLGGEKLATALKAGLVTASVKAERATSSGG